MDGNFSTQLFSWSAMLERELTINGSDWESAKYLAIRRVSLSHPTSCCKDIPLSSLIFTKTNKNLNNQILGGFEGEDYDLYDSNFDGWFSVADIGTSDDEGWLTAKIQTPV
eukprot:TRINITY_DN1442_c0_g1_i2.p1 TRINITY_DN1442_c0_g1~~TRINITY_DN1442_c0_g1_i2.p1  ORF type:complete len:111 (-),score=7.53 TRINITY_DN1442_c0_g1_i2:240-572(-)